MTIIPRGMALGATQQSPGADRHLMAQAELESRLRVLMGGYASERLVLGSISTGAENDLKEATRLASHMVAHYGMSERLGPVYYEHEAEHPFLGQRIGTESGTSSSTITVIEEEARRVLGRALEEASAMLTQRRRRAGSPGGRAAGARDAGAGRAGRDPGTDGREQLTRPVYSPTAHGHLISSGEPYGLNAGAPRRSCE